MIKCLLVLQYNDDDRHQTVSIGFLFPYLSLQSHNQLCLLQCRYTSCIHPRQHLLDLPIGAGPSSKHLAKRGDQPVKQQDWKVGSDQQEYGRQSLWKERQEMEGRQWVQRLCANGEWVSRHAKLALSKDLR